MQFFIFLKKIWLIYLFYLVLGATLNFEVELIMISDSPPTANVFKEIDADNDNQLSREEVRKMARQIFI